MGRACRLNREEFVRDIEMNPQGKSPLKNQDIDGLVSYS